MTLHRTQLVIRTCLAAGTLCLTLTSAFAESPLAFRVQFGLTDRTPSDWSGSLRVSGGEVTHLRNWRPRPGDQVGVTSWRLATREGPQRAGLGRYGRLLSLPVPAYITIPGVIVYVDATQATEVSFETPRGRFTLSPMALAVGEPQAFLDSAVVVDRVPAADVLSDYYYQDDFVTLLGGPGKELLAAWIGYRTGTERIRARRWNGDSWEYVAGPDQGRGDHYWVKLGRDRLGRVWAVWSEQIDGNWDLYGCYLDGEEWSAAQRLTSAPQPDAFHSLATDANGQMWLVWQGSLRRRFLMTRPPPFAPFAGGRREFLLAAVGGLAACAPPDPSYREPEDLVVNVTSRDQWARRRETVLYNLQLVMGEYPKHERPPLDVQESETADFPRFTRTKISYISEENDRVPAYLLMPKDRPGLTGKAGKTAGMLCLHQTTKIGKGEPAGVGGKPDLHYAKELAERGYVALAPDYPNFGDYQFDPYANGYASATMKGIWNHARAVDLLQSLPEVDKDRIGSIGHSLGGHNTLYVGAFDERIRALVTSCGFNSFYKYKGGDLSGWSHKGYMPRIAERYSKDPAQMPFDFTHVLAAQAPRAVFINAPVGDSNFEVSGVRDCVNAAMPIYDDIFGAGEKLVAVYPDAGHEFPPEIREQAYQFLDRWVGTAG